MRDSSAPARILGDRFALAQRLSNASASPAASPATSPARWPHDAGSSAGLDLAGFAGCELWRAVDLAPAASAAKDATIGRVTVIAVANDADAALALETCAAFFQGRRPSTGPRHPSVPRILASTAFGRAPWVAFEAGLGPSLAVVNAQPGTLDDALRISLLRDLAGALRDRMRHPKARVLGPLDASTVHLTWDGHAYLGAWRVESNARFSTSMRELTTLFSSIVDQHRDLFHPLAVDPFAFADAVDVLASRTQGASPKDVARFLATLFAEAHEAEVGRLEEDLLWASALEPGPTV